MRITLNRIAFTTSASLALALTFGCSSDDGDNNSSGGGSNSSSSGSSIIHGTPVTYEGETYPTVVIGTQTWFAKNLNYNANYSKCNGEDGEVFGMDDIEDKKLSEAEVQANCAKYGRLYAWEAAKTACPSGWHLPSKAEWDILKSYIIENDKDCSYYYSYCNYAKHLKATSGWYTDTYDGIFNNDIFDNTYDNGNGIDTYGFAALPGGSGFDVIASISPFSISPYFFEAGYNGCWWSSSESEDDVSSAYYLCMGSDDYYNEWESADHGHDITVNGEPFSLNGELLSVRCISNGGNDWKCNGMEYNPATQFCSSNTVYSKCNGMEYSPATQFCSGAAVYSKCNGMEYNAAVQFCFGETLYTKCGGKEYSLLTHECVDDVLYSSFTDSRDSKKYKTVDMGSQVWMAENLNYEPPSGNSKCPDNSASNCTKYGRQYDWATAMALATTYNASVYTASAKHKGICPSGWHVPSQAEWDTLSSFVGTDPGTKLKAKTGWNDNGNGTDDYGFSALPGGYGTALDSYYEIGDKGLWWTSDEYNGSQAYNRAIYNNDNKVYRAGDGDLDYSWPKQVMLSIRCAKD